MKKQEYKVRGYQVIHMAFDEKDNLGEVLGKERLLSIVNSYLSAHEWNSNFERALVDLAVKAGNVREVEKDEAGKIVSTETFATFLKRTKFTLTAKQAQELADTIVFPPVVQPRAEKVDKDEVERLQLAQHLLGKAESLERYRLKVAASELLDGSKIDWPDFNGETSEDEDAAALAEVIKKMKFAI